jgi:hypothetical protein
LFCINTYIYRLSRKSCQNGYWNVPERQIDCSENIVYIVFVTFLCCNWLRTN